MSKFLRARCAEKKARQERLYAVERMLLDDKTTRETPAARMAIAYCAKQITEHRKWYDINHRTWLFCQTVVIIGSVIATLAGVMTIPRQWLPLWLPAEELGWLRGVPAAVVTIFASLLSSFTYREDAARNGVTEAALWNELNRFQSHAAPYGGDEGKATSLFSNTVARIVEKEVEGWRALVMSAQSEPDATKEQKNSP